MTLDEYCKKCKKASQEKHVAIYGAGKIGQALKSFLEKEQNIFPDAFIVTDKHSNRNEVAGLKVYELDEYVELHGQEKVFILVAAKIPWNKEIVDKLDRFGNIEYLDITPDVQQRFDIKPSVFEINAVVGCSIACKYCPQPMLLKAYHGIRVMLYSDFCKAVDKIPPDQYIGFSGFSEPFLNPDITKMIKYASKKDHRIWLNSTLVGMTETKFEEICDIPIARFTLHLPDKNMNARIPITEEYIRVLKRVLSWTQKKNGHLQHVVTKANGQGPLPDEIKQLVNGKVLFHAELADRAGNLNDASLHSIGTHRGRIRCNYSPALTNFVMMPNGDIYLCCMDFGLRHKVGNILEKSYDSLLVSQELKAIRAAMDTEDGECLCRHCTEAQVVL